MASSATALLKLEKIASGEKANDWGDITSVNLESLEAAVAGEHAITSWAGDVTLDDTQYIANESRKMMLSCSGTLGANRNIIVPARTKLYVVRNNTSGAFTLTVKTAAGTGVTVTQGYNALLYCDATNVETIMASDQFLDVNGDELILDADGDSSLRETADDVLALKLQGFDGLIFDGDVESPVNGFKFTTSETGAAPAIEAQGETNVDLELKGAGAGGVSIGDFLKVPKGGDIASASPLVIDTDGVYFDVTGVTGFSAMTVAANRLFILQFDGALPITQGAGITVPSGANITTAAGDQAICYSTAANTVVVVDYIRASGKPLVAGSLGKHTIGVGAGGIFPATTNGCAGVAQGETTANKVNYKYLAYDQGTIEYGHFDFPSPKSYDASTLSFIVHWTHPAATLYGVVWTLELLSLDNDDAMDTAYGTGVDVTDTGGTTEDFYESDESAAVTPSNTPAKQDRIFARISRKATDGGDTLDADAHLIGITILYSTDAGNDA